jgi:hypothetical protein
MPKGGDSALPHYTGGKMKVWDHNTCNDENESLRQQLAAALAACKLKDEALRNCEGMLDELRDYPITHDAIIEALALQPDDSALKARARPITSR